VIPESVRDPLRERIKQYKYYVDLEAAFNAMSASSSASDSSSVSDPSSSASDSPAVPHSKASGSGSESSVTTTPLAKVAPFYGSRVIEREHQQGFFRNKWSHDMIMPTSSVLAAIRASQQIRRIHTLAHTIRKIFK
jgi:hypothetical protein